MRIATARRTTVAPAQRSCLPVDRHQDCCCGSTSNFLPSGRSMTRRGTQIEPFDYPPGRISIQHHNMETPLTPRDNPQKPSSRFSEGVLCKILNPNFREYLFHALG